MSSDLLSGVVSVRQLLQMKGLTIPVYQRPYKWKSRHINQLFQDVDVHHRRKAYRLGTIVFHRESRKLNIVDGQQRILSLVLMLWAILDMRKSRVNNLKLRTVLDGLRPPLKRFLDNHTFSSLVGQRNLYNNYQEIKRLVQREEFTDRHIKFLLDSCQVVTFELGEVSEAFQFFDAQNARGRDLDPHDLLKAFHLREFSDAESGLKAKTVAHWERLESKKLVELFATYLYRIRQWAQGYPAQYFTKEDTHLFKGVNLERGGYPFVAPLRMVHEHLRVDSEFPFQLDQTVINGRRFFEMAQHYQQQVELVTKGKKGEGAYLGGIELSELAGKILGVLNTYGARTRTGDKYVRSMFDCLLLYYIDRFGYKEISRAIEKAFIWSYRLRLMQHAVQFVSIDKYVQGDNAFRRIRSANMPEEFLAMRIEGITGADIKNNEDKGKDLVSLFREMHYYG